MAGFQFRLESVLKVRQSERRQRQLELAEALQAEHVVRLQITQLEQEQVAMRERCRSSVLPGAIDVDRWRDVQRYKVLLAARLQALELKVSQLEAEVERRRQVLVEADRQVRVLEQLRERKREEFVAEELRREVVTLDEVAGQAWLRGREQEA
jgi:flagellar FliJ protein